MALATLRKWKPVDRRPRGRGLTVENTFAAFGFAAIAFVTWTLMPKTPAAPASFPETARRVDEAERARSLAEARRIEDELRQRQQAAIKAEKAREQAALFNQRYNTDRMPVGSVNGGPAEAPAASP